MAKKTKYCNGVFVPKNPKKYKGAYPIIFRSSWELKFAKYCDSSASILEWHSESHIIPYRKPIKFDKGRVVGTRPARYFPDFVIKVRGGDGKITIYCIEVKPYMQTIPPVWKKGKHKRTLLREETTWAVNQAKWVAAVEYCRKRGWVFKTITEYEIFNKKRKPKR